MGLFDKKYCSICGEKIGLLGNRKLADGNLCKNCAAKLSPFMTNRRESTIEEIKEHLQYREDNKKAVASFNVTKTLGSTTKILIDEDAQKFIVTSKDRWQEDNPDVIAFSQVTGCNLNTTENRTELYQKDKDGNNVSYDPPRYDFSYDFHIEININSPYFQSIEFRLNDWEVKIDTIPYQDCRKLGDEICRFFTGLQQKIREEKVEAAAPKIKVICPHCGASTEADANGCCKFCGAPLK